MAPSHSPQHVLIFGATSAVASEVALLAARRGSRLHLVGRSPAKLEEVAAPLAQATSPPSRPTSVPSITTQLLLPKPSPNSATSTSRWSPTEIWAINPPANARSTKLSESCA